MVLQRGHCFVIKSYFKTILSKLYLKQNLFHEVFTIVNYISKCSYFYTKYNPPRFNFLFRFLSASFENLEKPNPK